MNIEKNCVFFELNTLISKMLVLKLKFSIIKFAGQKL